eukprot:TRINITY_DN11506_c0_g1_i1.p1 TRINITY_DN11506_c0_g1~~TRINITY_DN11506_c0_g1_i1.p1  ORF type:complete len:766 (-),score=139.77 TRINITY_DN11506_c0_g1_i1:21-2075(-)
MELVKDVEMFEKVDVKKAFINIRLKSEIYASAVLGEYFLASDQTSGSKGHVLLEFSSPNTNKPQHLGHVRNNCLGDSLSRILSANDYKVTKINLVNDRGIHICKSMLAYEKFGKGETPESSGIKGDHLVGKYYVMFETHFVAEYKAWLASDAAKEFFEKQWDGLAPLKAKNAKMEKKFQEETKKLEEFLAQQKTDAPKKKKARKPNPQKFKAQIKEPWPTFVSTYKDKYFNNQSELGRAAKDMLVKWENEDTHVRELWLKMNSWVFAGFSQTYKSMGIEFDHIDKESQTYLLGKGIVDKGLSQGLFEKCEDGSVVMDLKKVPELKTDRQKRLLRSDGTSVYMTQDLGTASQRLEKFAPVSKMIYVVATEQDNHFVELFAILKLLLPDLAKQDTLYHRSYGMVNLPTGRMKSREGTVVDADDLLEELSLIAFFQTLIREREERLKEAGKKEGKQVEISADEKEKLATLKAMTKPGDDEDREVFLVRLRAAVEQEVEQLKKLKGEEAEAEVQQIRERARIISIAALKYYMLAPPPNSSVAFDVNKSLDFTAGKTGPYNLYSYVRTRSVLRAGGLEAEDVPFDQNALGKLEGTEEREVLATLSFLNKASSGAAQSYDPSKVCDAIFKVSKAFSAFFSKKGKDKLPMYPILNCPDEDLRNARLQLCVGVGTALKHGLSLLGIETLEKM